MDAFPGVLDHNWATNESLPFFPQESFYFPLSVSDWLGLDIK